MAVNCRKINYSKIYKKIDKKEIISFDIFDTLIVRMVNKPNQVFDIVQKEYNKCHNKKINNFNFIRTEMERYISKTIPSLEDIYKQIEKHYDKDTCAELKRIEIEVEKKYCVCNKKIKRIYDYCKEKNKTIYAISDMYLSKSVLDEILKKNGYQVDEIIVSCEEKECKKSTKLFKKINVSERKKMLHIGDSIRADYIGAKLANIHAIRIKRNTYDNIHCNIDSIRMAIEDDEDYFYKLGYSILGPVMYEFAKWLDQEFEKKNINNIFFFSREGMIYKKVFDILYGKKYITKYLYVSRKTMTIANYKNEDIQSFKELLTYFTIKKDSTVLDFTNYIGIEMSKLVEGNKKVYECTNNEELYRKIKSGILKKSQEENDITKKYLEQESLKGSFAVVDIGWNGTMQKCMEKFLKNNRINNKLEGFYFMTFSSFDNSNSFIKKEDVCYYSIHDNPVFVENMFQAVDGSTIGYRFDNSLKIIPIKKEIEFNKYSMNAIKNIDKGIIDFINNWILYGYVAGISTKKDNLTYLNNYILKPKIEDIRKYNDFCYSDIKKEFIISKSKNVKVGLISSAWKYGYLKKIMKINLNYQRIIKLLKR